MSTQVDPQAWGVEPSYFDIAGHCHDVPAATIEAVLAAMAASGAGPAVERPLVTVAPEGPWPELPRGRLALEGGGHLDLPGPDELPLGYHRLEPCERGPATKAVTVAVCPRRCPPPPRRAWGWSVQLYAARSEESWGMGDFGDLALIADWAGRNGASFVLVNPLHAPVPGPDPEPSPYFPSSRCFMNPLYLRVSDVPGAAALEQVGQLAERAKELNRERIIDRKAVWALKSQALEALFEHFESVGKDEAFELYVRRRGRLLDRYTSFCVLYERFGRPWWDWPEEYATSSAPGVGEFAASPEGARRKRYHAWLQWLCEGQLARATQCRGVSLMCDLAVGADPHGADAWLWQEVVALQMRVGAPPDDFNEAGQDWGVPPWDPWRLRAAAYEPYIEVLRSALGQAKALRVDHVMGLFRLFWVPLGRGAASGAYVRYPWQDMLALLRLEAWRAGAYVVGEDLGTVEEGTREALEGSGVLSYKLFWFEPEEPAAWPEQALGAVTTHDLPTVLGAWTSADLAAQRRLGLPVNEELSVALRQRISEWAGCSQGFTPAEVVEATYACLASAPCSLLAATLDDAALSLERPNMPGTVGEWPNWRLALPLTLEALREGTVAAAIAERMNSRQSPDP
jgi:4-alpha-glucanotransferase